MKIETKLLREGLAIIKPGLQRRQSFAICEHVRLSSDGKTLKALTCNLEAELEWRTPIDAPEFDLCVPGLRFISIVDSAGEEVEIKAGKRLSVTSSSGKYQLPTLSGADMPTVLREDAAVSSGEWAAIREEVGFCSFAASGKNIGRPYLLGVAIRAKDGKISVSASDTLLIASGSLEQEVGDFEALIPTASCGIAMAEYFERFEVAPGLLTLFGKRCVAKLKLSAEKFPHDFIPKICAGLASPAGSFAVSRTELLGAIAAVSLVCDKTDPCSVQMNGRLILRTASDGGEASAEISGRGANIQCGMRLDQFLEMAKRAPEAAEFCWAQGFPEGSGPLLTKNGRRVIGAVPYKL